MRTSASLFIIILTALGIVPFVFATYLSWSDQALFDNSGLELFVTYSAIILSFRAGTLWGQFIYRNLDDLARYVLISSNIIALGAWFSLLMNVPVLSIGLLCLGFISTFWVEISKHRKSLHSKYLNMRLSVTTVVCVLHLLVLYPHQ